MSNDRSRRGVMLVVSSPSGAGKTTLCRRIIDEVGGAALSISATTREIREGEADGVDYDFKTQAEFQRMIDGDEFLEWAKVYQNFYGTPRQRVEDNLTDGVDVVFDVDWQGARKLKSKRPGDVVSVFVLPPSIAKLKARLAGRPGTDKATLSRRMAGAGQDILRWGEYDYAIVNDDLDKSFDELRSILMTERTKRSRAGLGQVVDQLLSDAEKERG